MTYTGKTRAALLRIGLWALAACMAFTAVLAVFPAKGYAASFSTLAPVTKMSYAELVGDNGDYRELPDPPAAGTYKLLVDKYYQFVTVFKKNSSGKYVVCRYMPCSTGSPYTPTRVGTYKIKDVKYRFKAFEDFACAAQYWTLIAGETYFHSVQYFREDADTIDNASYRAIGTAASHGCVRLLVPDARWIYYNIAPGTLVTITPGEKDASQAAIKNKLKFANVPSKKPDLCSGRAACDGKMAGLLAQRWVPSGTYGGIYRRGCFRSQGDRRCLQGA